MLTLIYDALPVRDDHIFAPAFYRTSHAGMMGYLFGRVVEANPIFTAKLFAIHELGRNALVKLVAIQQGPTNGVRELQKLSFKQLCIHIAFDTAAITLMRHYQLIGLTGTLVLSSFTALHLFLKLGNIAGMAGPEGEN